MGAALIGLLGALLGAAITVLGTTATERRKDHRDELRWRRDQRVAAYDGALRHLLRAANLRSEFVDGNGAAVLRTEHQREWFDDLVQAQFWLHTASQYCEPSELARLLKTASELDYYIERLVSGERWDSKRFSISAVLQDCIAAVTDIARTGAGAAPIDTAFIVAPARQSDRDHVHQRIGMAGRLSLSRDANLDRLSRQLKAHPLTETEATSED